MTALFDTSSLSHHCGILQAAWSLEREARLENEKLLDLPKPFLCICTYACAWTASNSNYQIFPRRNQLGKHCETSTGHLD